MMHAYADGLDVEVGLFFKLLLEVGHLGFSLYELFA